MFASNVVGPGPGSMVVAALIGSPSREDSDGDEAQEASSELTRNAMTTAMPTGGIRVLVGLASMGVTLAKGPLLAAVSQSVPQP